MRRMIYLLLLVLTACSTPSQLTITNSSEFPVSRIEAIDLAGTGFKKVRMGQYIHVRDSRGENILSQLVDTNADSIADQLLIWVSIPAGSSVQYQVGTAGKPVTKQPDTRTYCRFVPERMDDFAWENDKVAFRVYGPKCEELFEQGNPGGLISSGIDCWLKRVDYPVIDKWYKKGESGGSYHHDDGEGLDNFHVGVSRGCGGTAIRSDGEFIYSRNFSEWQILANGPLRSVFKLKYKPVMVEGKPVIETKIFTIDKGDYFYRCDVEFESELPIDTLAIGLTLHGNKGHADCSSDGWISYWEPIDDSEIGLGAFLHKVDLLGCTKAENAGRDMDHIWMFASPKGNKVTYYAGFGWKKSGQFPSGDAWIEYIKLQVSKLYSQAITTSQFR